MVKLRLLLLFLAVAQNDVYEIIRFKLMESVLQCDAAHYHLVLCFMIYMSANISKPAGAK